MAVRVSPLVCQVRQPFAVQEVAKYLRSIVSMSRVVEDRAIEPVRHDQADSAGIAVHICTIFPFIDPREAMHPAFADLAQRRGNRGGLKPVESGLQTVIVACTGGAAVPP